MYSKRALKYGTVLTAVGLATYYRRELKDTSIGVVRFGRAVVTVEFHQFTIAITIYSYFVLLYIFLF